MLNNKVNYQANLLFSVELNLTTTYEKYIFFGHMSVGFNIMNGLRHIFELNKGIQNIKIIKLESKFEVDKPAIYHIKNGKNGYPKSKCDSFKEMILEKNLGNQLDIAFFKLCYVDIHKDTHIEEVFKYYVNTIDEIKKDFSHLKIIHVTLPLYSHAWGLKGKIKRVLRPDLSNVQRNLYNELLRKKYKDKAPIYDLAKIESTLPDGSRSFFQYKGKRYYSLYDQYSSDGGHLNELGQLVAAKELLKILAEVSEPEKSE